MASRTGEEASEWPHRHPRCPSPTTLRQPSAEASATQSVKPRRRRSSRPNRQHEPHVRLQAPLQAPRSPGSSVYMGSYGLSPRRLSRSRSSLKTPGGSAPASPRLSASSTHLAALLPNLDPELDTYGVEELRDGFFDATFLKPPQVDHEDLLRNAEYFLPVAFQKRHPLSPEQFLPKQWEGLQGVMTAVSTSRAGVKLSKSFVAFFIAYILCLVPTIRIFLGRYSYVMALSTILNHPGRTIGAQIDGMVLTTLGSATGLGWGAFAIWLSHSTATATKGYGGILAAFLALFLGFIAALRSYYIRLYQFVLCAGISVLYTCLADTSEEINWTTLFDYGIPWLFGQVICIIVCCVIFPDAGARPLAVALHDTFAVMQQGLVLPQPDNIFLHRRLAFAFVKLSQAYRDLALDISLTRFPPSDVGLLRNLMQAVIRSLLSLKMETRLFDNYDDSNPTVNNGFHTSGTSNSGTASADKHSSPNSPNPRISQDAVIDIDPTLPSINKTDREDQAMKLVASRLADPTASLLKCMTTSLQRCDAVLMGMSGYRQYLGPPKSVSDDILGALNKIRKEKINYDEEEDALLKTPAFPPTYSDHPGVVELFLFVHPVRQAINSVEALLVQVMKMQQQRIGWRIYLPSYPWHKALNRTNAQVRHDRGGVTAGFYFRSQTQLARTMQGMANTYKPLPHQHSAREQSDINRSMERSDTMGKYAEEAEEARNPNSRASVPKKFRYRLWSVLHRLQGFETRFALKVVIVTSLLSIPAWLPQSRGWWSRNESWWAVIMAWIMLHPRTGGNFQDLVTRALCGILGAIWGGLAYGARNGNPYVMAVFAAVYMLPMIYRFTQSSHPRSGIVGCISFVVVSLGIKADDGLTSTAQIAWTRGVAFVVGVVAAVLVNWILWPFVARHELRKALAAMMIYSSIIYRGVVAKYVYYEKGEEPGKEDIERSEMLEGRLREGFVRIRQLMALTRHEIRLRGPFNAAPHSALISSLESFFEYLVAARQSSIFFHPHYMSNNEQAAESLLAYRRDAVAAILMNLYVLAGALRGNRKVPRYLPSAANARKRLLDHMAEVEMSQAESLQAQRTQSSEEGKKWSQVYSYSYSQSLTGCVKQLEQLQQYTKEIVGEQGFDILDEIEYEDLAEGR